MAYFDTIIIGAGPAGLSAASILQRKQSILIIDEYYHYGGRLLGQLYEDSKDTWWNGLEVAEKLYSEMNENVTLSLETSVYSAEKDNNIFTIYTTKGDFTSKHLIVATGAKEKSAPLAGWDLPGVMTVGAAQVLTNFQRVKPGDKGVIIGINPLSMVIGMELGYADIGLQKICLPPDNFIHHTTPKDALKTLIGLGDAAPSRALSLGSNVVNRLNLLQNLSLQLFPKNGVKALGLPISIKERAIRINGTEKVESVTTQKTDSKGSLLKGSENTIECDFVCISNGLSPLNEVASLFNLKHLYVESLGGYVPLHGKNMKTEIDHLYVAGNITGIENAKIAMLQGQIAATQIIKDTGLYTQLQDAIEHERKNAKVKFHKDLEHGRDLLQYAWEKEHK